jgi:hypothetical protein
MGSFHLAAGPKKSWLFITNPKDINCQSNPKPDAILQILDLAVQKLCAPNKTTSSATVCCSLFAFELAAKLPKIIAGPDINHVFGPKMPLNLLKLFSSHSGGHGCLKIRNYPEKKKTMAYHTQSPNYPIISPPYGWIWLVSSTIF